MQLRPHAVVVAALLALLFTAISTPAPADAAGTRDRAGKATTAASKAHGTKRSARGRTRVCKQRSGRRVCRLSARSTSVDRTAPRVRIASPLAGATVSGKLRGASCLATATDRSGVAYVDFHVDGKLLNRQRLAPWNCSQSDTDLAFDTTQLTNGSHTLRARAVDKRGNAGTTSVRFTVANRTGATPPAPPRPETPSVPEQPTTPAPPSTDRGAERGAAILDEGFESGFGLWNHVQRMATDRISTGAAPGGRGGSAARFEIRPGDLLSGSARAELAYWNNKSKEGAEETFTWSTMFAADYPSSPLWQSIVQWKNDGTGSPPLSINLAGEELFLQTGSQHGWKRVWSTPLVRGEWMTFTARIKWSADPNVGWIELLHNGRQVLPRYKMQTLYTGLENYFKVGLYRHNDVPGTGVVYHDDVRIGRV